MKEYQRLHQRKIERKYNRRKIHETSMLDGTADRKFTLEFLASLQSQGTESEVEIRRLTKRALNAAHHRK